LKKNIVAPGRHFAYFLFYRETYDSTGPLSEDLLNAADEQHSIRVAEDLYLRNDYRIRCIKRY